MLLPAIGPPVACGEADPPPAMIVTVPGAEAAAAAATAVPAGPDVPLVIAAFATFVPEGELLPSAMTVNVPCAAAACVLD